MMRRREFITLLGGAAAACPLAAQAQQPALPVIGWLDSASLGERREVLAGFHTGLQEISYREGQNVMLAYSWAEHLSERIAPLAVDLARRQVAVIVASGAASALSSSVESAACLARSHCNTGRSGQGVCHPGPNRRLICHGARLH